MMSAGLIKKIQALSLKWKILLPFMTFAFVGTISLDYIGLTSQKELIIDAERQRVLENYKIFLNEIEHKKNQILSIATVISSNREFQSLLSEKDRPGILRNLSPLFKTLKTNFGINVLHVHIPPSKSFLRFHALKEHGEMIPYRKSIMEAQKNRKGIAALEWGPAGLAIRGVVPVLFQGKLVGSIEVGYPFDKKFLENLKKRWGPDFTVYEKKAGGRYTCVASTLHGFEKFPFPPAEAKNIGNGPSILVSPPQFPSSCVLLGPIRDYFGDLVAIVQVNIDRSEIEGRLKRTRQAMLLIGLGGIFLSFVLTWLAATIFVRPIREIVTEAQEIADGKRDTRLESRPGHELEQLTESLNKMLESLQERQRQIEEYARTLELRVKERTADLIVSEEKYRTLVDNLPLVVYRILRDGTTEFINPYFTEKLGYTPEEIVGDKYFWSKNICGYKTHRGVDILKACWKESGEFRIERTVKSKSGQTFVFIDQAIPLRDSNGEIKWFDGIMLDITELKNLQERALRAEEVRVLSEMSARFAHELRNPITIAGGFARRLSNSLPENDQRKKFARIIVQEISRLENMLQIMLSSIEPLTLSIAEINFGKFIRSLVNDIKQHAQATQFELDINPDLPVIRADEGLLARAFSNILDNSLCICPQGEKISLRVDHDDRQIMVIIKHKATGLGEEDIEQFFMPRLTTKKEAGVKELPLSKVIIYRHGGSIDVSRDTEGNLVIKIRLPKNR